MSKVLSTVECFAKTPHIHTRLELAGADLIHLGSGILNRNGIAVARSRDADQSMGKLGTSDDTDWDIARVGALRSSIRRMGNIGKSNLLL